jgi:hypothetical protein
MENFNFTPLNSLTATDTKDESAGEYLQSLEFRVTNWN